MRGQDLPGVPDPDWLEPKWPKRSDPLPDPDPVKALLSGIEEEVSTALQFKMSGTLAYEFRKYAKTHQFKQSDLAKLAIKEFLAARGIST